MDASGRTGGGRSRSLSYHIFSHKCKAERLNWKWGRTMNSQSLHEGCNAPQSPPNWESNAQFFEPLSQTQ